MVDTKQPKFAIVPAAVVTDPRLSNAAKVVYQSLALHAGKDRKCIPSRALIASYQGIDRSAVTSRIQVSSASSGPAISPIREAMEVPVAGFTSSLSYRMEGTGRRVRLFHPAFRP